MKNILRNTSLLWIALAIFGSGCERYYVSKETAYPRIAFPEKAYKPYKSDCPFEFNIPVYATVSNDESDSLKPCYINVNYPQLNARLHLSYENISSRRAFFQMVEDADEFVYKHAQKAEKIVPSRFATGHNVHGIWYDLKGNTASSIQFFATDSNEHYLRGALYINSRPNKDSLTPVIEFLRHDLDTMLISLRWK
ncbi:MAG: gliding motility lipoprotein GldD [Bacteroidota bacterium]|nr:gliding motility lipoprotein GldD [Bacteroidota bacterium]